MLRKVNRLARKRQRTISIFQKLINKLLKLNEQHEKTIQKALAEQEKLMTIMDITTREIEANNKSITEMQKIVG